MAGIELQTSREQQHEYNNHKDANNADAAMTEAISIAAETATKTPQQKDDKYDEKNCAD